MYGTVFQTLLSQLLVCLPTMSKYRPMSVLNADDAATFQTALSIISDWAQDWQLGRYSVNKCSVLNTGKNVGPIQC